MKKTILKLMILAAGVFITFTACQNSAASGSSASGNSSAGDPVSGSGNDTYMEMTISTKAAKNNISFNSIIKTYIAANGKARSEMYKIEHNKQALMFVGLVDVNKPLETILIDDDAKTYSINHTDTAKDLVDNHTKSSATKIGNETLMGYNCVHARVTAIETYKGPASFMNGTKTTDLWLSPDVPVSDAVKKFMQASVQKNMGGAFDSNVSNQLQQMGCKGFMVKMQIQSKDITVISQLSKVTKGSFPASKFEVPAGYKKTDDM